MLGLRQMLENFRQPVVLFAMFTNYSIICLADDSCKFKWRYDDKETFDNVLYPLHCKCLI